LGGLGIGLSAFSWFVTLFQASQPDPVITMLQSVSQQITTLSNTLMAGIQELMSETDFDSMTSTYSFPYNYVTNCNSMYYNLNQLYLQYNSTNTTTYKSYLNSFYGDCYQLRTYMLSLMNPTGLNFDIIQETSKYLYGNPAQIQQKLTPYLAVLANGMITYSAYYNLHDGMDYSRDLAANYTNTIAHYRQTLTDAYTNYKSNMVNWFQNQKALITSSWTNEFTIFSNYLNGYNEIANWFLLVSDGSSSSISTPSNSLSGSAQTSNFIQNKIFFGLATYSNTTSLNMANEQKEFNMISASGYSYSGVFSHYFLNCVDITNRGSSLGQDFCLTLNNGNHKVAYSKPGYYSNNYNANYQIGGRDGTQNFYQMFYMFTILT